MGQRLLLELAAGACCWSLLLAPREFLGSPRELFVGVKFIGSTREFFVAVNLFLEVLCKSWVELSLHLQRLRSNPGTGPGCCRSRRRSTGCCWSKRRSTACVSAKTVLLTATVPAAAREPMTEGIPQVLSHGVDLLRRKVPLPRHLQGLHARARGCDLWG